MVADIRDYVYTDNIIYNNLTPFCGIKDGGCGIFRLKVNIFWLKTISTCGAVDLSLAKDW